MNRPRGRRRFWGGFLAGVLGLCLLALGSVRAQGPAPLALPSGEGKAVLAGHLSVLEEPGGAGRIPPGLQSAPFQPLAGNLSAGFGRNVVWLRFRLQAAGPEAAGPWWLDVAPPFTNDIALYAEGPQGLQPLGRAGTETPFAQHPIAYRQPVFVLDVPADKLPQTYYLRIASNTSRQAQPVLWRAPAFARAIQLDLLLQGVFFGGLVLVAVFHVSFGVWLRESVYLRYAAYVLLAGGIQLVAQGLAPQWLFPEQTGVYNILLGVLMAFNIGLGTEVFQVLYSHRHFPRLTRLFRRVSWVTVVGLLPWALAGQYQHIAPGIQLFYVIQVVAGTAMAIVLWRRGDAGAGYYLLAFVPHAAAMLLFLPRNLGWLPVNFWTVNTLQISIFVHMLLMSLAVTRYARGVREDGEKAKADLLQLTQQSAQDLERKVAERTTALQQALLRVEEARSAQTELLANVSHDLRSPLTAIMGYAQLLQADSGKPATYARTIYSSSAHMLRLVNDLIDFARAASSDTLQVGPLHLPDLLVAVGQEARGLAEKNRNTFVLDLPDALPSVVLADDKRLRQVLRNLLDNACQFTQNGTVELRVAVAAAPSAPGGLRLSLQVQDSGCGIALHDQAKVFTPFYRADTTRSKGPMGLGLPLVDLWVQRMHGTLQLTSQLGQGSTFTVEIPVRLGSPNQLPAERRGPAWADLPPLDGGGRQVWVVEDHPDIRGFLVEELTRMGFEVHSAADGQAFIQQQLEPPGTPPPSLVLTDHLLPGAEGTAVLAAVRQHWPGVPVMLLSASPERPDALADQPSQRFDACLLKPIELAALRSSMARLLNPAPSQAAGEGAVPAAGGAIPWPPPEALGPLDRLIALGALTDLTEWAQALPARYPACQRWSEQVLALLARGDIAGLQHLLQRGPPPPAAPPSGP
ncbi:MAG: hybrid sensor histidine kinase/response regulator [Burkholderiaceae bacterium]|nr:hybrid sensor histidine kinase/response regulator [Burkholderiaceae bacterium]